jgi:hypothetical protein
MSSDPRKVQNEIMKTVIHRYRIHTLQVDEIVKQLRLLPQFKRMNVRELKKRFLQFDDILTGKDDVESLDPVDIDYYGKMPAYEESKMEQMARAQKTRETFLLPPYGAVFYRSAHSFFNIIKDYSYANSSTVLSVSFFYPLLHERRLDVLLSVLGLPLAAGDEIVYDLEHVGFERKSDLMGQQGVGNMHVDFYMKLKSGKKIFFESKNHERFEKVSADRLAPNRKFNQTYQQMVDKCPFIKTKINANLFNDLYQLMRYYLHLSESQFVVLLHRASNEEAHAQIKRANRLLNDEGKRHVKSMSWEVLVPRLIKTLRRAGESALAKHYVMWMEKKKDTTLRRDAAHDRNN